AGAAALATLALPAARLAATLLPAAALATARAAAATAAAALALGRAVAAGRAAGGGRRRRSRHRVAELGLACLARRGVRPGLGPWAPHGRRVGRLDGGRTTLAREVRHLDVVRGRRGAAALVRALALRAGSASVASAARAAAAGLGARRAGCAGLVGPLS